MKDRKSLDPADWRAFRAEAHAALDHAISHMENRADAPVWQPVPATLKKSLSTPVPALGTDRSNLSDQVAKTLLPFGVGNTHSRFFGWVHGAGSASGVIPDIYAAAMNANLGGRDHGANYVEKQVISWVREIFDFPEAAGGLVVSGTSMATLIAMKSARDKRLGTDIRRHGLTAETHKLVAYASAQAHACVGAAFDILGLGQDALRAVETTDNYEIDTRILRAQIAKDIADGFHPFCVIGTAGTVNVGSVDPLDELAEIAAENGLWFHVDGAFGALAVLTPALKPRIQGIERADSVAFDFHKWMHVNYDAGFILMRDSQDQLNAFSDRPDYLAPTTRGLAAENPWFCEFGPELSRGFRALKVWFQIAEHGTTRLGESIARNCDQAAYLAGKITTEPALQLMAPVALNIVCFRYLMPGMTDAETDALNNEIVIELQERGLAAPSTTKLNGRLAIRVNITNHRTQLSDLDGLIDDINALGQELSK